MAWGRLRRTLSCMSAAVALIILLVCPLAAHAALGYVITQHEGASRSQLTLAPGGLRFDSLAPTRRRGKAKPQLGVIVRYRDAHLFLLDPPRRSFQSLSLATAVASYRAEAAAARKGQPSERLPQRPGSKPTIGQARLTEPRAKLTRLRLSTRIGPVRAHAYLLRQGASRERLWYSAACRCRRPRSARCSAGRSAAPRPARSAARSTVRSGASRCASTRARAPLAHDAQDQPDRSPLTRCPRSCCRRRATASEPAPLDGQAGAPEPTSPRRRSPAASPSRA